MEWVNAKLSAQPHNISRMITLFGSVFVALSAGTNYMYSAYAPQLGARLNISHTQLNIIGLAGNMGGSISGPVWGRIVDRKGPRIPLIGASICLFVGYMGIKQMYDGGIGYGTTASTLQLAMLIACNLMAGSGAKAALSAAVNTTAKSFPPSARATTIGLVLSGLGLSAFWFSLLIHTLFPGDTSACLLTLALGTAIPMVVGLFIIKPVPSHLADSCATIEGYDPIPSSDGVVFVGEGQVADPETSAETEAEADSVSLLSCEEESSLYRVPVPPFSVELNPLAGLQGGCGAVDKDGLPDIHGKQLWLTPDFHLVFTITAICSGTGLMYINNVGSIAQALYAKSHTVYDDVEASKWQATQVSTLSLGNFAGRMMIGLISDFAYTRLRLPRVSCLCLVSFLFIISQVSAMIVSTVEMLWVATLLLGLAYGSLFGGCPSIMIDWFGMAHFSENWGYITFSPILGGNLFSLMFGLYLDAHTRGQDARSSLERYALSSVGVGSRGLPSEHQCFDGKACYLGSLQVTLVACIVSFGLSWWAGIRDGQKVRARNASVRGYAVRTSSAQGI